MKSVTATAVLVATLLGTAATAMAAPAVTTGNANVRQSGSTGAPVLTSLPGGATIDATCYDQGWCQIYGTGIYNGVSGWVSGSLIAFTDSGSSPRPPAPGPGPRPPAPGPGPGPGPGPFPGPGGGPGFSFDFNWGTPQPQRPRPQPGYQQAGACFFSERNFRGSSFCLSVGDSYERMPRGWNDIVRSVQVYGRARVDLCSDTGFYGNCVTVRSDQTRLPSGIDRRISSVDVY